jgi:hypothetical protein
VPLKIKRKPSKFAIILLLPALISILIMGWGLTCMGYQGLQKSNYNIQNKLPRKDNVTIMPIVFEEPQEIELLFAASTGNSQ